MNRRQMLCNSIYFTLGTTILPPISNAYDTVTITIQSSNDQLGIQISDATVNGKTVVAVERIITPNKTNKLLQQGMILKDLSSKELVNKIKSGPYPIQLDFYNLASGGDAIGDLGTSIVQPKDALGLSKNTNNPMEYKVTTITNVKNEQCAIKSRRNDVLEIDYEAYYINTKNEKILYDSTLQRSTNYQMVLGSGDMIPGVDQGLYDMCPGEVRVLEIPPFLGHGRRSLETFRIPLDYVKLVWKVNLVSMDGTVRRDNNVISREERESRFSY